MEDEKTPRTTSRRDFLKSAALTGAAVAAVPMLGSPRVPESRNAPLSRGARAVPAARRGGTLVVSQASDIDPKLLFGIFTQNNAIGRSLFNTLIEYGPKGSQYPIPSLATHWERSRDGLTVALKLRSDVKFHTGRPFGPQDVIFNLQQMATPTNGSQYLRTAAEIHHMVQTGPDTLELKLRQPLSNLLDLFEAMFIMDRETFADVTSGKNVVGTGPFTWDSWTPGSQTVLKRNPHYWKKGLPYLDRVEVHVVPEIQSMLSSLEAGQSQIIVNPAPTNIIALQRNPSYRVVFGSPPNESYYVGCNTAIAPFDKIEVRQAVGYGIDRDKILKEVYRGIGEVDCLPWASTNPAYSAKYANYYTYNPAKSRALLRKAGLHKVKATLAVSPYEPSEPPMAEIIQYTLNRAGFDIQVETLQASEITQRLVSGTLPEMWILQAGWSVVNPASLFVGAFPYNAHKNASNFVNSTYQRLAQQAWIATSKRELNTVYQAMAKFLDEQAFVLPCVLSPTVYATTSSVTGLALDVFAYMILDEVRV